MEVIEALAQSASPLGVTELGRMLGLQKSNVHRILKTMQKLGYVQKEPGTARYLLSLKLWELGTKIIDRNKLRRAARPFMRQLHQETDEFVYLAVLSGSDILYLETIDAVFPLRLGIVTGARVPAVFPASGKALLAYQPNAGRLIDQAIRSAPDPVSFDRKALIEELCEIRACGFATSVGGWTRGRNSVAAPVIIEGQPPVAVVGVGGPSERMSPKRLVDLATSVLNAATRIAETLGTGEALQYV